MDAVMMNRWIYPAVILMATDLSDLDRLMHFATDQAKHTGARLIVLHVVSTSESVTVDAAGLPYYDPSGAVEIAAKALESCCTAARHQGVTCDGVVREGNVAQQVLAAVRQFKADRILLGTRSRGKLSKLLIGSVAEQVLRSADLPVITVGPEAHLQAANSPNERLVLHATTMREASRPSAALACQIASTLHAKLLLLHVLPSDELRPQGSPTGMDSSAMRELTMMAAEIAKASGAEVEPRMVHGNPSIEILAEAVKRSASLVVLGSTQRSALQNLTRDRTVYKVLAHAGCPVMTLREASAYSEQAMMANFAMHI